MALVEAIVEADQHFAGTGGSVRIALDLHTVATGGNVHAEPLLDGDQVAVVIAEQRAEQVGLLKLQLEARTAGIIGDGGIAAGHQAAALVRTAPCMLFGPADRRVTGTMSPATASVST